MGMWSWKQLDEPQGPAPAELLTYPDASKSRVTEWDSGGRSAWVGGTRNSLIRRPRYEIQQMKMGPDGTSDVGWAPRTEPEHHQSETNARASDNPRAVMLSDNDHVLSRGGVGATRPPMERVSAKRGRNHWRMSMSTHSWWEKWVSKGRHARAECSGRPQERIIRPAISAFAKVIAFIADA